MTTARKWQNDIHSTTDARFPGKGFYILEESAREDDHELVSRVQNGDLDAYDELMLRHQEAIAAQMRRFSQSTDVVEDLTQTVFVKAYQGLGAYEPRAPFIHWLRTIANRVGYEHWRQEARRVKCVPFHDNESLLCDTAEKEAAAIDARFYELAKVMQKLKPAERQTLYMMYVDGMSVAEIARCMGWNQAMTKMRAYRARIKLRKILNSEKE